MPLYEYECGRCGPFRDWRTLSQYKKPAKCPDCGKPARRAVASPRLGMDWQQKKAHGINEKSAHEPRVMRRRRGDPLVHDAHADLSKHREKQLAKRHAEPKATVHKSHHPWMVRH
jgi:putative FmdB family regulatory protein